jgi:hypothetical protein
MRYFAIFSPHTGCGKGGAAGPVFWPGGRSGGNPKSKI